MNAIPCISKAHAPITPEIIFSIFLFAAKAYFTLHSLYETRVF